MLYQLSYASRPLIPALGTGSEQISVRQGVRGRAPALRIVYHGAIVDFVGSGGLSDEVDVGLAGDDAALITHGEDLADGFAAVIAIVQCALVDVHADEAVGEIGIEVARELHGVLECGFAVVHGMLDAGAQSVSGDALHLGAE